MEPMATFKCPKCEKNFTPGKIDEIDLNGLGRKEMKGYAIACSHCNTIISAFPHPEILDALRTKR